MGTIRQSPRMMDRPRCVAAMDVRFRRGDVRSGVILPVVLMILVLLGLLTAVYSFSVHANSAALQAQSIGLQTRLAAEAGVERVKQILRKSRGDVNAWYDNAEALHRIIVWAQGNDASALGTNEEFDSPTSAFRFSIVADDPTDDLDFVRYGITDESSKLNLNQATSDQLFRLVFASVKKDQEIDAQEIVDAIIDWRDSDSLPTGRSSDTEGVYYEKLEKPYRPRNGPFDTVEELLLVKGVGGNLLFGEDVDRNGLLTANEDDGDLTFPPDDQDGRLHRGLYPFLTTASYENNVSNDQRPRASLKGHTSQLQTALAADFEDEPAVIEYLVAASKSLAQGSGGARAGAGAGGVRGGRQRGVIGRPVGAATGPASGESVSPDGTAGEISPDEGSRSGSAPPVSSSKPGKPGSRRKSQDSGSGVSGSRSAETPRGGSRGSNPLPGQTQGAARRPPRRGGGGAARPPGTGSDGSEAAPESGDNPLPGSENEQGEGEQDIGTNPSSGEDATFWPGDLNQGAESSDGQTGPRPIRNPASLYFATVQSGQQPLSSPLRLEHLPILMDRLTVEPATVQRRSGLINVNTAPAEVLSCLELTDDQVQAILEKRGSVSAELKQTPAWLVTEEVLDLSTFEKIASFITARGQQFTIESLGFADHVGAVFRLQVVVDMIGPMTQTLYSRDLTYLGARFPIRKDDKEKVRVR